MDKFMKLAIEEAKRGIQNGDGGPFGAVIVKDGKVVGKGHNCVVKEHDPTCHGEMQAIRQASKNLDTFDLKGCVIYTTGEPCPMCLGAIIWAHIDMIYYGCNVMDTATIGFADEEYYKQLYKKDKSEYMKELDRDECLKLYDDYKEIKKKTHYQTYINF